MNEEPVFDPSLLERLEALRAAEPRDPQRAAAQKAAFLFDAEKVAQPVSKTPVPRLGKWNSITNFFSLTKERVPMFKTIIAVLTLVGMLFGGGTVAAAQTSLPDDALYSVKLWTEDTRLALADTAQAKFDLTLAFENRRIEEIQTLLQANEPTPDAVLTRLETHLDQALRLAAALPDAQAQTALTTVQTQLQTQQETIATWQFQTTPTEPYTEIQNRLENTLELHLGLAQGGVQDPQWLRNELRIQLQPNEPNANPWTTGTPTPGSGYGPGEPGINQNPWTTGTPTPGSGYGPGDPGNPWTTGTPTPGSGYGPGEPGINQNPWTTGTPTPGSGYGPGPGTDPAFTPSGNGSGTCGDCGTGTNSANGNNGNNGNNGGDTDNGGNGGNGGGGHP